MSVVSQIAVLLAPGFEEIEAVSVIDVLRRAEFAVRTVAVAAAGLEVSGAHALPVRCDCALQDLKASDLAMVVLPGGMPGALTLAETPAVTQLVRDVWQNGGLVSAICAGPLGLHAAGILVGKRVTAYPGIETKLGGAIYTGNDVEIDDRIITSKGPATALKFALQLVESLGAAPRAQALCRAMLVDGAS